jgi:hypothetical protein
MDARGTRSTSAGLEATRRRFEQWRQSRSRGRRIPESLWAAAVRMARMYGVARASSVLRVDYYALKKRLEQKGARSASPQQAAVATFVELAAPVRSETRECILEFEDADGAKMRIHVKGVETPDLVALSRSFWES